VIEQENNWYLGGDKISVVYNLNLFSIRSNTSSVELYSLFFIAIKPSSKRLCNSVYELVFVFLEFVLFILTSPFTYYSTLNSNFEHHKLLSLFLLKTIV